MYGSSDPADYVAIHLRMGNLLHEDGAMERDGDRVQVGARCRCTAGAQLLLLHSNESLAAVPSYNACSTGNIGATLGRAAS